MKNILVIILSVFAKLAIAQESIEMADRMRADGKIYVVVAIVATILIGLFIYLFSIDRRLNKLEKNN
ncbi:CcmD family protein [Vicingaceae bacterium]|jgi:CcmD family protein|nr:CcmD family protein [Vicingaceae bacterium]